MYVMCNRYKVFVECVSGEFGVCREAEPGDGGERAAERRAAAVPHAPRHAAAQQRTQLALRDIRVFVFIHLCI